MSTGFALRRTLLLTVLAVAALLPLAFAAFGPRDEPEPARAAPAPAAAAAAPAPENAAEEAAMPESNPFASLSEAEWRKRLTAEQYHVLREKGTERAFTGRYWETQTPGTYCCAGCGAPLFLSDAKFDSGCGWPSFFQPLEDARLVKTPDNSLGMRRVEVTCRRCGGHLGHVFDDGPPPTGLRFCINSISVRLEPAKDVAGGNAAPQGK